MPVSRSKRKPRKSAPTPAAPAQAAPAKAPFYAGWLAEGAGRIGPAVLLFLSAPLLVAVSQAVPHIYFFGELGFLFTFTVYDIALALLGLGVLCAGLASERQFHLVVGVFCAALLLSLFDFIALWQVFLAYGLDDWIYLVTPVSVGLTGVSLWLPERLRYGAALVLAVLLAFDIALFIGLQEFARNINVFSFGAIVSAVWLLAAPAFLLRHFKRPWLPIAGRILGSWLVAIELLIFTFAVVPMPVKGG